MIKVGLFTSSVLTIMLAAAMREWGAGLFATLSTVIPLFFVLYAILIALEAILQRQKP